MNDTPSTEHVHDWLPRRDGRYCHGCGVIEWDTPSTEALTLADRFSKQARDAAAFHDAFHDGVASAFREAARAVRQEAADTSGHETRAAVKKALAYLAPPHTEGAIAAAVATLVSLRAALEGATERPLDVERLRQAMDDAEKLSLRLGSYVGLDLAVADLADAVVERYARLASPTTETPDA
jgi:hypothetical protein